MRGLVPPGCSVGGMPVVSEAKVLGLLLTVTGGARVDWEEKVQHVRAAYSRLAAMRFSAFGRGWGASSYGMHLFLQSAELSNGLPLGVADALQALTTKLVDGGHAPNEPRGFPGVRAELLIGSPREGGFGVLPLRQHCLARHAVWCCRWAGHLFGLRWLETREGGRPTPSPAAGPAAVPPYAAALRAAWRAGGGSLLDFVNDFVLGAGGLDGATARGPRWGREGAWCHRRCGSLRRAFWRCRGWRTCCTPPRRQAAGR